MKTPRVQLAVRLMVVLGALLMGVSSCRFLPTRQAQDMRGLFLPPARASMLVIIVDQRSPSAIRATGALVAASARPRERIVILRSRDGTVLASSQAPAPPASQVPAPPAPLRPHSTSFQQAGYRQAVRGYQTLVHTPAGRRLAQADGPRSSQPRHLHRRVQLAMIEKYEWPPNRARKARCCAPRACTTRIQLLAQGAGFRALKSPSAAAGVDLRWRIKAVRLQRPRMNCCRSGWRRLR